jgi:hypothetical protein
MEGLSSWTKEVLCGGVIFDLLSRAVNRARRRAAYGIRMWTQAARIRFTIWVQWALPGEDLVDVSRASAEWHRTTIVRRERRVQQHDAQAMQSIRLCRSSQNHGESTRRAHGGTRASTIACPDSCAERPNIHRRSRYRPRGFPPASRKWPDQEQHPARRDKSRTMPRSSFSVVLGATGPRPRVRKLGVVRGIAKVLHPTGRAPMSFGDSAQTVRNSGKVGWSWHMESSGTSGTGTVTCSYRGQCKSATASFAIA